MQAQAFEFASSPYAPIAIGFFGLGTGYLVWGGQALFEYPAGDTPENRKTLGLWGFWMPGFMQFITGVYLMVGLTWFDVFGTGTNATPSYMAAVAFTAYGVHWFAMAHRRYIGASSAADAWMAIAFLLLSLLGAYVFFRAGDIPLVILFIGLCLVYLTEIPTRFHIVSGEKVVGLWQFLTGLWLMYLTFATVNNFALGAHWWL
jgi:hypothetical protein